MMRFESLLSTWGESDFHRVVKAELEKLSPHDLPLQAALTQSSYVSDEPLTVMVVNSRESTDAIEIKLGVFYAGVIAGCNCADDPTPVDTQAEYALLSLKIDKQTAEADFSLISE
jgi:hypothetical protein